QGAPDEWVRGDRLYPRGGPQPAGALDRARARRPCEGPAGSSLPHRAGDARCGGGGGPESEPLQVRNEEAQACGRREEVSRRKKSIRRPVLPDARYDSQTVSKFINSLMYEGKKAVGERIFYGAMD